VQGLDELERRIGVTFHDRELLERALTHRSYAFEHGGLEPNERLEFLGDAVLALVVTDRIFHSHPESAEGRLAKLRAAAVMATSLASVAREIELGRHVRLGRGEAASGGADKDSILADTLEAVLGAIYLDQGQEVAEKVILDLFDDRLDRLAGRGAALDYKTSLQELVAARFASLPIYQLRSEGPDHEQTFTATVSIDGQALGEGTGRNKKQAEQAAARIAYLRLHEDGAAARSADEEEPGARAP